MAYDWSNFLTFAEILHDNWKELGFDEETALRCVVSRAYYAEFCSYRNKLSQRGNFDESGKDHGRLIECIRKNIDVVLANHMETLLRSRHKCDYKDNLDLKTLRDLSKDTLKKARELESAIK